MKITYTNVLKGLARFQVRHPFLTVLMLLMITLFLFGGVSKVRTVASLEQMMPSNIDEIKSFNDLRDNALGQDIIAVVIELDDFSTDENGINDMRDKEVYDYIRYVQNLFEEETDILETYSYADFFPEDVSDDMYAAMMHDPELKNYLSKFVNDDYSVTMILATTDVSADDPRMKLLAEKIQSHIETSGHPNGVKIRLTGTPIIQQKLGELIAKDRNNTQNISTLLVFIITMILFGTFTSALVPILIVFVSVNWLYGIMGYANLPISTLAGGVAAMVIGIGIDYAIHLMNKFKNERKDGNSIEESIITAVTQTGTALTGAAIATVLAFLAFLFGSMPEMNRFGLLMAIGVGSAFVLSIIGLPSLLIIEEKLIHKIRKKIKFGIEGEYSLYEKNEIHPDTHEVVDLDHSELKHLLKDHKICTPKNKQIRKEDLK